MQRCGIRASRCGGVYAGGNVSGWQLALQRWDCSEDLDTDLHHGITPGCPSSAEWRLLSQTWRQLGKGKRDAVADGGDRRAVRAGTVRGRWFACRPLLGLTKRLEQQVEEFEEFRLDLLNSRDEYGNSVHVTMPEFWR